MDWQRAPDPARGLAQLRGQRRHSLRTRTRGPEIRQRYYDALTGTGNSLTARKEITSRFTRLASQSLALEIDELADGPNQVEMVIERITGTIMAYGAERIPVSDHALARSR